MLKLQQDIQCISVNTSKGSVVLVSILAIESNRQSLVAKYDRFPVHNLWVHRYHGQGRAEVWCHRTSPLIKERGKEGGGEERRVCRWLTRPVFELQILLQWGHLVPGGRGSAVLFSCPSFLLHLLSTACRRNSSKRWEPNRPSCAKQIYLARGSPKYLCWSYIPSSFLFVCLWIAYIVHYESADLSAGNKEAAWEGDVQAPG